jgi:UDP-N-acetylglucosamine 2-epimerase (non-hydrolysing)
MGSNRAGIYDHSFVARHKIMSVVGTRPNFMKTAPVVRQLRDRPDRFEHVLVHTGQHYDDEMSQIFIDELAIGEPDYFLGAGAVSHAQQIARIIERLEPVIEETKPDLVLVPGDGNSTLAAAIAAMAAAVPVGHIEAGLRTFDRMLPEETNRVVVDAISELLFTHSPEAKKNLLAEGRAEEDVFYVGNTMIDTLVALSDSIGAFDAPGRFGVEPADYIVVTLHRHWLFSDEDLLRAVMAQLYTLSEEVPIVFPMHPRTRSAVRSLGMDHGTSTLRLVEPLGYLEFLALVTDAAGVITDSGGIQEETTFLNVPCFTFRPSTERPVTVSIGTNTVLGLDPRRFHDVPSLIRERNVVGAQTPRLWDGHAAARIVEVLASVLDETGELTSSSAVQRA